MRKRRKNNNKHRIHLILLLLLLSSGVHAQQASITGSINYIYRFGKTYLPIKVYLTNKTYKDSTVMDSAFHYQFKHLPGGIYQLRVSALRGQTGFKEVWVTDVTVTNNVVIPEINLEKIKLCEAAPVILGLRKEKEYYKTGELRAEGKYLHSNHYSKELKRSVPYYKKEGVWKYFLKTGELAKKCLYKNDQLKTFSSYYQNGHEKESGEYNDGCPSGDWKRYSEDGKLQYVVNLDNIEVLKIAYPYLDGYMSSKKPIDQ